MSTSHASEMHFTKAMKEIRLSGQRQKPYESLVELAQGLVGLTPALRTIVSACTEAWPVYGLGGHKEQDRTMVGQEFGHQVTVFKQHFGGEPGTGAHIQLTSPTLGKGYFGSVRLPTDEQAHSLVTMYGKGGGPRDISPWMKDVSVDTNKVEIENGQAVEVGRFTHAPFALLDAGSPALRESLEGYSRGLQKLTWLVFDLVERRSEKSTVDELGRLHNMHPSL